MNTFTGRLDQLEAKLQYFIEGKLARLSSLRGSQNHIARRLIIAMRAGTISTGDGTLLAPDQFTVFAHPSQAETLCDDPELLLDLADLIEEIGIEAGFHFGQHPAVKIAPNEDVAANRVDIVARISDKVLGNTTDLNSKPTKDLNSIPPNAFLIVNGTEVFPLNQSVINIGRRSSNQLAIEDPRVSREHAQIRAAHGRYEIFDLDSTGGTFINKKRITQSVLRPGDVISLAGVPLIYGQERSPSIGNTKKFSPPANLVDADE
jgi:hypothetical protein